MYKLMKIMVNENASSEINYLNKITKLLKHFELPGSNNVQDLVKLAINTLFSI